MFGCCASSYASRQAKILGNSGCFKSLSLSIWPAAAEPCDPAADDMPWHRAALHHRCLFSSPPSTPWHHGLHEATQGVSFGSRPTRREVQQKSVFISCLASSL